MVPHLLSSKIQCLQWPKGLIPAGPLFLLTLQLAALMLFYMLLTCNLMDFAPVMTLPRRPLLQLSLGSFPSSLMSSSASFSLYLLPFITLLCIRLVHGTLGVSLCFLLPNSEGKDTCCSLLGANPQECAWNIGCTNKHWLNEWISEFLCFTYRLWGCEITPFSCAYLSSALSSNQNLVTLDLGQNFIGYSGVKTLYDVLKLQSCPLRQLRYDPPMPHRACSAMVGFGWGFNSRIPGRCVYC